MSLSKKIADGSTSEPTLIELLEQCAGDEETFSAFVAGLQQDTSDAASLRSQRLRAAIERLRAWGLRGGLSNEETVMFLDINGGPSSPAPAEAPMVKTAREVAHDAGVCCPSNPGPGVTRFHEHTTACETLTAAIEARDNEHEAQLRRYREAAGAAVGHLEAIDNATARAWSALKLDTPEELDLRDARTSLAQVRSSLAALAEVPPK